MDQQFLRKKRTQKALRWLAIWLHRHTYLVLVAFVLLTVFFGVFALRLEHKTTLKDLLPEDNLVVRQFKDTVRDFDLVDKVVLALQFEPEHLEDAQFLADIFVEQVREDPEFSHYLSWLNSNLFDQIERTDFYQYLSYITRFLPQDKLEEFAERLSPEGIQERIRQNYRDLQSGIASKTLIEKDPLALLDLAAKYRDEITGNYHLDVSEGYLVSKDHSMLLVLGQPQASPEDVDFSVALMDFLEAHLDQACRSFQEEEERDPANIFKLGFTGAHPITAHEDRMIKSDVSKMFISSFALVLFLFIIAYGRPLAIFYVGIPLLCAEVWTLGIGYFLFGGLNILAATFSAVIVGLGIDFAIHIFSRYLDERISGREPLESMQLALSETGLGTLVAGGTTALAFLSMGFTNFSGLVEFACVAALGIVLCMVQMFIFLPCILFVRERLGAKKAPFTRAQHEFQLEPLLRSSLKHRRGLALIIVIGTMFMGYQASHLRFNADIRSVRARSNPAIALQSRVTEKVGGSLRSLTFIMEADTEKALYDMHEQLEPQLARLQENGTLVRYDSLLSIIQSPEKQARNQAFLRQRIPDPESVEKTFFDALHAEGFKITDDNRSYISHLAESLMDDSTLSFKELLQGDPVLIRNFLFEKDGQIKTLVHIYPAYGLWKKDATQPLVKQVLDAVKTPPGTSFFVTGIQTLSDELKKLVEESFHVSTGLAGLLVILFLFVHFRKISLVALTLVPLCVSLLWMLGTMKLLGMDIHILNFVATPIIIGIGIDDGVHIVEKYLYRRTKEISVLIASCAKAVTLTSLTTVFGFSSLFMAEYSGFQSLGLCAILGVFYCWLGAVVLLPILMETLKIKFVRKSICTPQSQSASQTPTPEAQDAGSGTGQAD